METIVKKSKYRIPTAWKEEVKEEVSYKTRDGQLFNTEKDAIITKRNLTKKNLFFLLLRWLQGLILLTEIIILLIPKMK